MLRSESFPTTMRTSTSFPWRKGFLKSASAWPRGRICSRERMSSSRGSPTARSISSNASWQYTKILAKKTIPAGSVSWNRTRSRWSNAIALSPRGGEGLYKSRGASARLDDTGRRAHGRPDGSRLWAHREGACPLAGSPRSVRAQPHLPAHLGDGALQPALQVLHARGGRHPPPTRPPALVRGDRAARRALRGTRGEEDPPHRRGASRAARHRRP